MAWQDVAIMQVRTGKCRDDALAGCETKPLPHFGLVFWLPVARVPSPKGWHYRLLQQCWKKVRTTQPCHPTVWKKPACARIFNGGGKKGTGPICRNGPEGASHKLGLSPFSQRATALLAGVRQQGHEAGSLDRLGHGVLADGRASALAAADDFALPVGELFQQFHVLVIDVHRPRPFSVEQKSDPSSSCGPSPSHAAC